MNLGKKKKLAARALKVGKERIIFLKPRLDEIKEANTKQDIKDLKNGGAIVIKEIKGRKEVQGRKRARRTGKIKKRVKTQKKDYMIMTRKLRKYVDGLKENKKLDKREADEIRKKIRNKGFRSKAHLREFIGGLRK